MPSHSNENHRALLFFKVVSFPVFAAKTNLVILLSVSDLKHTSELKG